MLEHNSATSYDPIRKFLVCGVGGVLLGCVLALIPHNASAIDFPEYNTSDYDVRLFTSNVRYVWGCNTVRSGSGILAVGPRGSITGADNNPFGCGYHLNNSNNLTWSDSSAVDTVYDLDGAGSPNITPRGLSDNDYVSKNFRTMVYSIGSTGFDVANANKNYWSISAQDTDSKYGRYVFMSAFKIPPDEYKVQSHLTPAIDDSQSNYSLPNNITADQFKKDIFDHTIMRFADNPADYVPADLANYFALKLNVAQCGGWSACNYAWIITYIPQYSSDYTIQRLTFNVANPITQNTIDVSLGGFSQWEVGAGNNSSSNTWPKLSYMYLGRPYTLNNSWSNNIISDVYTSMFRCVSATCSDQLGSLVSNVENLHNEDTSGWDFSENVGGSWFDVFHLDVLFPFTSLFSSFTNNRCVDIPIISSWIHSVDTQYCTWWSQDIRNTLTPVFNTLALMILFGFVIHWLNGSSGNLFKDNNTSRLEDRF